jgi:hypothetical protein
MDNKLVVAGSFVYAQSPSVLVDRRAYVKASMGPVLDLGVVEMWGAQPAVGIGLTKRSWGPRLCSRLWQTGSDCLAPS